MKMRPATTEQMAALGAAVNYLEKARDLVKKADCPKTVERVRLALTSAQGAERHMRRRLMAAERD